MFSVYKNRKLLYFLLAYCLFGIVWEQREWENFLFFLKRSINSYNLFIAQSAFYIKTHAHTFANEDMNNVNARGDYGMNGRLGGEEKKLVAKAVKEVKPQENWRRNIKKMIKPLSFAKCFL